MDIVNFITQLLTLFSVIVAIVTIKHNSKLHARQMNAEVFMKYAERYEQIMSCFPENAFRARFNIDKELPAASPQLTLAALNYVNVSGEEFYLWKKKYVADEAWKIWEHELIRTLQSPLLIREWKELEPEFQTYPDIVSFVKEAQRLQVTPQSNKALDRSAASESHMVP